MLEVAVVGFVSLVEVSVVDTVSFVEVAVVDFVSFTVEQEQRSETRKHREMRVILRIVIFLSIKKIERYI
jgi:hypothetical protein